MNLIGTTFAAVALVTCGYSATANAAEDAPPPGKTYPAAFPKGRYTALNKLPDWGGVWYLQFNIGPPAPGGTPALVNEVPTLKGKYLAAYNNFQKQMKEKQGLVPSTRPECRPPGMPTMMTSAQFPIEFLLTPGRVTILFEAMSQWRVIYTDGRPHPEDWDGSFSGHSIGHWEGDTLVIDTVGIKPITDLSFAPTGHSDKLHVTERIHLAKGKPDVLLAEMTVEDPEALEKPFHQVNTYDRKRDWSLQEYICSENNRNPIGADGLPRFD